VLGAEPVVSASLRSEPAPLDRLPQALAHHRLCPAFTGQIFSGRKRKILML